MTFGEALAVLGIDARTDARHARRAYLRKVKEHKPERDPDGFQRVRTAWELVEPRLPTAEPEVRPAPPAPRPMPVVRAPMEPGRVELPADPPVVPDPELDEPVPMQAPPEPDLSAFVLEDPFRQVPDPAPWEVPAPPDARPWTVEPFDEPVSPHVDDAEVVPAWVPPPARPSPRALVQEARDLAPVDGSAALEALSRGLAASLEGASPDPDVQTAVAVVLELHRSGAGHQARAAWKEVRGWMDATGIGTRISGNVVTWLVLCRELSDLPVRFPPAVRRRLAEAISDADLGAAANDLLELYRTQPHVAIDAAELLEAHAPNLHKMYGASLRDPAGTYTSGTRDEPPPESAKGGLGVSLLVYLGLLLASIALRVCVADSSPKPSYDFGRAPGAMPLHLEPWQPPELVIPPYAPPRSPSLAHTLLCLEGIHPPAACEAAWAVRVVLETSYGDPMADGRCDEARAAIARAEAVQGVASDSDLLDTASLLRQIRESIRAPCAPEEPPVEP